MDNIVYVGKKDLAKYVNAVMEQFMTHNQKEVILQARGKYIGRAVDAFEVALKKLQSNSLNFTAEKGAIETKSEELEDKQRKKIRTSAISLTIVRKDK